MQLHLVDEALQLLLAVLQGHLHLAHDLLLGHLADLVVHLTTRLDHLLDVTLLWSVTVNQSSNQQIINH